LAQSRAIGAAKLAGRNVKIGCLVPLTGKGAAKDSPVNDMEVLKETDFNFLGPKKAGKVRDIYDRGDKLILITTAFIV